jgi:hypothetical protein
MRLLGMSIASALLLVVAACEVSPEQRAHDVANAYCSCVEVTPSAIEECTDMLEPQLPPISDDCLQCVYQNSATCSKLLDDCDDICSQSTP